MVAASQTLQVTPAVVELRNVQPGQQYSAKVSIKNLDSRSRSLRIKPPATKCFTLKGAQHTLRIAPGMEVTFEVEFQVPVPANGGAAAAAAARQDHHDVLIVTSDVEDIEVPLRALVPGPQLVFGGSLDFGVVATESRPSRSLVVRNEGRLPAEVMLQCDGGLPLKLDPAKASIAPGASLTVTATLTASEPRAVAGELLLLVDGRDPKDPYRVSVGASVVSRSYELVDTRHALLRCVEFGDVMIGQRSERRFALFNNGPSEARFDLSYGTLVDMGPADKSGPEGSSLGGGEAGDDPYAGFLKTARIRAKARESRETALRISPVTGVIPPYGTVELTATFCPSEEAREKGFTATLPAADARSKAHDYVVQVDFVADGKVLRFPVKGRACAAALVLEPSLLHFGAVPCNDWADQVVEVHNQNSEIAAHVQIGKPSPYFTVEPTHLTIRAGTTASVLVRYLPKALGRHSADIPFVVLCAAGTVVAEAKCQVHGSSMQLGKRQALAGGTAAMPETFIKDRHFVDETTAVLSELTSKHTFTRTALWDDARNADALEGIGPEDTYGLTKDSQQAKRQHADAYTAFVRQRRTEKQQRYNHKLEGAEDDVNAGMAPHKGLTAPRLQLPKTVDPLWTVKRAKEPGPTPQNAPPPDVIASIPLYKESPETTAERIECSTELNPEQLSSIVVGPRAVDFGKTSTAMAAVQHFVVRNPLATSIHVVMGSAKVPELAKSKPMAQVIPAGASAKFPLTLSCHEIRSLRERIEYCINGCHMQVLDVAAEVVPVSLDLSSEEMSFAFSFDNWDPHVDQFLIMENPHPFPVEYEWSLSSSAFKVKPGGGTVKPRGSVEVSVRWEPDVSSSSSHDKGEKSDKSEKSEKAGDKGGGDGHKVAAASAAASADSYMVLRLKGGAEVQKRVHLHAELPQGLLKFREKSPLDLGELPCGVPQTVQVLLQNTGSSDAAYRLVPGGRLTVTPDKGRVLPESSTELDVSFTLATPGPWTATLELEIRGGKSIKLPIKAECVVPHVEVAEPSFAFPPAYIGACVRLPFTLNNVSSVSAVLTCDLSHKAEFSLAIAKEAWAEAGYDVCPVAKIGINGEQSVMGSKRVSRRVSMSSSSQGNRPAIPSNGGAGYQFVITLKPHSSLPMTLTFRPMYAQAYSFHLPLTMHTNGAGGAAAAAAAVALRRVVTGEGVQPHLVLSKSVVDFGQRVVLRHQQSKTPYTQEIYVRNNWSADVQVEFGPPSCDKQHGAGGAFVLEPKELTLPVDGGDCITLGFCPHDVRTYEAIIPVYLNGDRSKPHLELEVSGSGTQPRLTFDRRECVLPPVPLGVPSRALFHVQNAGFDNLELRFRLPPDEERCPLTLSFPEGSLIGLAKETLPVVVSFTSKRPMSFTANVDFLDEDGRRYSLPVTATADNSLVTISPFLRANAGLLAWTAHRDGLLMLQSHDGYQVPEGEALGPLQAIGALPRYLNATTTKGPFGPDLRKALMASRGKVLIELVEMLGGKHVPIKTTKSVSPNRTEAALQLLTQYEALLTFLKSHGALLNGVKPEMLLEPEDFTRVLTQRTSAAASPDEEADLDQWAALEASFETVSAQAWNALLSQLFRVFVLSRVTIRSLRALPGFPANPKLPPPPEPTTLMGPTHPDKIVSVAEEQAALTALTVACMLEFGVPSDACLAGSNVFSESEACLMAWLTWNMYKAYPSQRDPITNFDSDLQDCAALMATLANHWPAFAPRLKQVVLNASHHHDIAENAELFVRCMSELGLAYEVTVADFESPEPRDMLLLALYLYVTLPQLTPRTTVEFLCKLGETQVRDVELTNPSQKVISYSARLEGHKDFSLEQSLVKMEPGRSMRLPVKCSPTTAVPREARLILMSRRDGTAIAAPLVFLVHGCVDVRSPLKRIEASAPLYELTQVEFSVINPFPQECDFTVSLIHEAAEQPPKPKAEPSKSKTAPPPAAAQKGKTKDKKGPMDPIEQQAASAKLFPAPWGLERARVRLRPGGSEKMRAAFLPFTLSAAHRCTVMFHDDECGDFCYELVGSVQQPAPFLEHRSLVGLDGVQSLELALPFTNHQLEGAKRLYAERHPLGKDKEQSAKLRADIGKIEKGERVLEYAVACSSGLMTCSTAVQLRAGLNTRRSNGEDDAADASNKQSGSSTNCVKLSLKPQGTGAYPARLLLSSPYDVRVVMVELTAQSGGAQFALELECAARQSVVQEIPLINASDAPLSVAATLIGKGFSGPREVTVPPGVTASYPLTFAPQSSASYSGSLELAIVSSNERNVYALSGKAGEPLAEGHITVDCQARQSIAKRLNVANISGTSPITYSVYCDLDCVNGPESLTFPTTRAENYKFSIMPLRSGVMMGTLSLVAPSGDYIWYSIEIHATEPPSMGTIDVACPVRKAMTIKVDLTNPLEDRPLVLRAIYSDPALVGPEKLTAPPGEATTFQCFFAPLVEGNSVGSIRLVSDEVGEFWWTVNMSASPSGPESLPPITAQLGRTGTYSMAFSNPLGADAAFSATATPGFSIRPGSFVLGPYGGTDLVVEYVPGAIGVEERGCVTVASATAGAFQFECTGKGEPPGMAEPCQVACAVGSSASDTITWENPFNEAVSIEATLITDEPPGIFRQLPLPRQRAHRDGADAAGRATLGGGTGSTGGGTGSMGGAAVAAAAGSSSSGLSPMPSSSIHDPLASTPSTSEVLGSCCTVVPPLGSIHFPVGYSPALLRESRAELRVTLAQPVTAAALVSEPLVWRYPIIGLAHVDSHGVAVKMKCRARESVEQEASFVLAGLGEVVAPDEVFTAQLLLPDAYRAALQSTLSVEPLDVSPSSGSQPLRFRLSFAPLKAFSTTAQLAIRRASGGRWVFDVHLTATDPDVDSALTLEAHMGCTAELPLLLFSSTDKPQPFTAAFTPETPLAFDVEPTSGLLLPEPEDGVQGSAPLRIVYTCKDIGKVLRGQLVVQTPDKQYSYTVLGQQPKYVAPDASKLPGGKFSAMTASTAAKFAPADTRPGPSGSSSTGNTMRATATGSGGRGATSSSSAAAAGNGKGATAAAGTGQQNGTGPAGARTAKNFLRDNIRGAAAGNARTAGGTNAAGSKQGSGGGSSSPAAARR